MHQASLQTLDSQVTCEAPFTFSSTCKLIQLNICTAPILKANQVFIVKLLRDGKRSWRDQPISTVDSYFGWKWETWEQRSFKESCTSDQNWMSEDPLWLDCSG